MTEQEKKQSFGTFRSAGYAAFHMAHSEGRRVIQPTNPYRIAPFSDLWLKGWREAESEFRRGVPFRSKGYDDKRVHKLPASSTRPYVKRPAQPFETGRTQHRNPNVSGTPKQQTGVNLNRLSNRFNNKRTKV